MQTTEVALTHLREIRATLSSVSNYLQAEDLAQRFLRQDNEWPFSPLTLEVAETEELLRGLIADALVTLEDNNDSEGSEQPG